MILKYVVSLETGRVRHAEDGEPRIAEGVLFVSKFMNQEAKRVVFENITYNVKVVEGEAELHKHEKYAFANFRNVKIEVELAKWYLNQHRKPQRVISSYLYQIRVILHKRADQSTMRITIAFKLNRKSAYYQLQHERNYVGDPFDPPHQFAEESVGMTQRRAAIDEYKVAWQRAHALFLAQRMRVSLGRRAPYLSLETNVEQTGHNISISRIGSQEVLFRDLKRKKQGRMTIPYRTATIIYVEYQAKASAILDFSGESTDQFV